MVLGVALAFFVGLRPWHEIDASVSVLVWSVAATVPLLLLLLLLPLGHWDWLREIIRVIEELLVPLFANTPTGAVALVSLLAGVGEELLFRGVIQAGLEGVIDPVAALVIASLLFGLAHTITPAYFVLASLMGIYLGLLYQHTGNLLVPIMVHALYDWIAIRFYLWRSHAKNPGE